MYLLIAMKKRNTRLPRIKQLPSGSYTARIYAGKDPDGKSIVESITRATYAEVQLELAARKADKRAARTGQGRTVRDMMNDYIDRRAAVLSPATIRSYRGIVRNNLQELLDVKLSALSQNLVQSVVNDEARRVAPKTVRNAYGLFSASLADEMPDVTFNIRMPQKERSTVRIPTEQEIRRIMQAAAGTDMEIPVLLGACCGMRRSEIAALTWRDVDLYDGIISIHQALVLGDDKEYHTKTTKTRAGTRTIKLFPAVVDALNAAKPDGAEPGDRITINPADITSRWRWVVKKAGVRQYRFHDLRHYLISVMLSLNVPKKYIADYVGHETENMIDQVYGHIMASKKSSVQDQLQSYFSGVFGKN